MRQTDATRETAAPHLQQCARRRLQAAGLLHWRNHLAMQRHSEANVRAQSSLPGSDAFQAVTTQAHAWSKGAQRCDGRCCFATAEADNAQALEGYAWRRNVRTLAGRRKGRWHWLRATVLGAGSAVDEHHERVEELAGRIAPERGKVKLPKDTLLFWHRFCVIQLRFAFVADQLGKRVDFGLVERLHVLASLSHRHRASTRQAVVR